MAIFNNDVPETLGFAEGTTFDYSKDTPVTLAFNEVASRAASFSLEHADAFAFAEASARTPIKHADGETLAFAESGTKDITHEEVSQAFTIVDDLLRKAGLVIDNLNVGAGDYDETTFAEHFDGASPIEYDNFIRFLDGDYEYQKAKFRVIMSRKGSDTPILNALSLDVDLPDIFERGEETLIADWNTITLARNFTVTPEVVVTQKGGATVGRAEVRNITTSQFEVRLLNASDVAITGTISWVAHGY